LTFLPYKISAESLTWTLSLPTSVLIAQAVFLLQRRQTDIHTVTADVTDHAPNVSTTASEDN